MLPTPNWLRFRKSRFQQQHQQQQQQQTNKQHEQHLHSPAKEKLDNQLADDQLPEASGRNLCSGSGSGSGLGKGEGEENCRQKKDSASRSQRGRRRDFSAGFRRVFANFINRTLSPISSTVRSGSTKPSSSSSSSSSTSSSPLSKSKSKSKSKPKSESKLEKTNRREEAAGVFVGESRSNFQDQIDGQFKKISKNKEQYVCEKDQKTSQSSEAKEKHQGKGSDLQPTAISNSNKIASFPMEQNSRNRTGSEVSQLSRQECSLQLQRKHVDVDGEVELATEESGKKLSRLKSATTSAEATSKREEEDKSKGKLNSTSDKEAPNERTKRKNELNVCHLTAKTSDNHCALHGIGSCSSLAAAAANSQLSPSFSPNFTKTTPPTEANSIQQSVNFSSLAADTKTTNKQQKLFGQTNTKEEAFSNRKLEDGDSRSRGRSINNNKSEIGGTRRRRGKSRRSAKKVAIASWPLAKQTLDNNSSYGDCEDISSPHLNGRLSTRLLDLDSSSAFWNAPYGSSEINSTSTSSTSSLAFLADERAEVDGACFSKSAAMIEQSNYNHKRPFAQAFERPQTGWIFRANGPERVEPNKSGFLAPNGSVKAKILAARGFRRWSYDDQEGDNDITIILQPSDLHDIEKRASYNRSMFDRAKFGLLGKGQGRRNKRDKDEFSNDLKLARCLLDQDYNLTVRLFIRESALNWNFNSFTFDAMCCGRSLTELLLHLFDYYNLYKLFKLDIVNVLKCFSLLEFGYHSTNPYHNSIHAADVTQAMHCFMQENKIRKHMTHLETLCSILAAVCHDLDHPGVNQSFLVATNNPLASLYNNNSVLENHHWRFALCIFKESQLFDHFEEEVFEEMKKQLKHLILATDIARQNEYLKRFKDLTSSREFSMQNTDDRALVLQMALKCADLGNPCRPWVISRVWSNLICDEFYKMGRIERQLGIPLTPICQREKTCIAGIQTDFFRFIVLPLLELWHKFLESPLSDLLMSNFDHNYRRWQRANRIIQQLRRRKSVACIEPVDSSHKSFGDDMGFDMGYDPVTFDLCSRRHTFEAIKRASSDYVKSGNNKLESLRNFQLDRIIERSPLLLSSYLNKRKQTGVKDESVIKNGLMMKLMQSIQKHYSSSVQHQRYTEQFDF